MDPDSLRQLLDQVAAREVDVDEALGALRQLPFENLGYATIDHHRSLRRGAAEVVFGEGKSPEQLVGIVQALVGRSGRALCTRVTQEGADAVRGAVAGAVYHRSCRLLVVGEPAADPAPDGAPVAVVTAGTSDLSVADEAALTLTFLGSPVIRVNDVGVAGLHRLLAARQTLDTASVAIVVAGMEGALPSVVAGLVGRPVIAVPTSVGYGASFAGLAALLGMLSSCASGVTVVNIDNGFGAAFAAHLIRRGPR